MTFESFDSITPRLIVENTPEAVKFYKTVFGVEEVDRFTDDDGTIVHVELTTGEQSFTLSTASEYNRSAKELGGSSVILTLSVGNPDALEERAVEQGATVVFSVEDRFYGRREGRFEDPFGHLWIIGRPIEDAETEG